MANLSKDWDAKLKGLPNDGSQLPKGFFILRKINLVFCFLLTILLALPTAAFAAEIEQSEWLDRSQIDLGAIGVHYNVTPGKDTKVRIMKGTTSTYIYTLGAKSDQTVWFPLQSGNGDYQIMILEHVKNNQYRLVAKASVELQLNNSNVLFLNSVQNVNWREADKVMAKAADLTKNSKTNEQKVKAIYNYVTTRITYDSTLAAKVKTDYIPDLNATIVTGKGICYGYASLFAAMLRSVGVPTKLVMGKTPQVAEYHAWNEVYLGGKWIIVDTTVDAAFKKAGKPYTMNKKATDYKVKKTY